MLKPVLTGLAPAGRRARLSTLIFHRVLPQPDPLFPAEVDAQRFDAICGWVARWFNVLRLDEAVRRLQQGRLPARALAITFDDGYEDNRSIAMPILQHHGLAATFFVATGFLDGGCMWNDRLIEAVRRTERDAIPIDGLGLSLDEPLDTASLPARRRSVEALLGAGKYLAPASRLALCDEVSRRAGVQCPSDLMMRSQQVRELRDGGMQVGAHTVSHPILARLGEEPARAEMAQSKLSLEAILDEPVTLFAYPNGRPGQDFTERDVGLARSLGFEAAVSTAWGAASAGQDLFQIPRFTPWDRQRWKFGARLARNLVRA